MEFQKFLSSLQPLSPFYLIYLILALFFIIGTIHNIFSILFAMHVGSEKNWKRLGFAGPILIFILLSIFESFIEGLLANLSFAKLPIFEINSTTPETWTFHYESLSFAILVFSIVMTVFLVSRTYHSINKKLSVY